MTNAKHVSAATTAAVEPDAVWAALGRLDRYGEWVNSTLDVEHADEQLCLGATWTERSRISGFFISRIRWRVVALDEVRRIEFAGDGVRAVRDLGFSVTASKCEGGTEVECALWYTVRYGLAGAVIGWATDSNVLAELRRSVRTLATLVEHDAGHVTNPLAERQRRLLGGDAMGS